MKELEKIEKTTTVIKAAALGKSAERAALVELDPKGYVKPIIKQIDKDLKSGVLVDKNVDRLFDDETKAAAAREYIYLTKLKDYIGNRMENIKGAFFETLNETEREYNPDDPAWLAEAPVENVPGEIEVTQEGIKFQRAGGGFDKNVINEKSFAKEHPVIYKSMIKEVTIPAVEERVVKVFDEEAFMERAKKDKKLQKFISKKYKNPQFRVYDIFDE